MGRGRRPSKGNSGRSRRLHQTAWAPYNFVPMADKPFLADIDAHDEYGFDIPKRHDVYHQNCHTGYFEVDLQTETPLFIRGMLTINEKTEGIETRTKDAAFSIDGQTPIIPGSSLRGMIRTLTEIVTSSKMHFVSDAHKIFFRAVAADRTDPLKDPYKNVIGSFSKYVRAGYLLREKGRWYIQPALKMGRAAFGKVKDKRKDGSSPVDGVKNLKRFNDSEYKVQYHPIVFDAKDDRVFFARSPEEGEQHMGVLVCTGNMAETQSEEGRQVASPRSSYAVVAERDLRAERVYIPDQTVKDYIEGRSAFQKEDPFDETQGVLKVGRPVFYIEEGGEAIHFGHTPNFRIAHLIREEGIQRAVTPKDLVPRNMRQENPAIDYAEALFGYVSDEKDVRTPSAYAGRVSVTSATVTEEHDTYYDEAIVPKILSSPKPTTFQHYLEQPNGIATDTHQLLHYGDKTQIRGHKLYWRQMIKSLQPVKDADQSTNFEKRTQHTIIRPVAAHVQFKFRVYFDNLTDAELGALIWVLTFGGDPNARHQMGMGKPFGLGVVRLKPSLTITNRAQRYQRLFEDDGQWNVAAQSVTVEDQARYVDAFKRAVGDFDEQDRIKELMALVQMREPSEANFNYMEIESAKGNDYQGRPVLPYPQDV